MLVVVVVVFFFTDNQSLRQPKQVKKDYTILCHVGVPQRYINMAALGKVTWLILPVVISLPQRLSHACLSISTSTKCFMSLWSVLILPYCVRTYRGAPKNKKMPQNGQIARNRNSCPEVTEHLRDIPLLIRNSCNRPCSIHQRYKTTPLIKLVFYQFL